MSSNTQQNTPISLSDLFDTLNTYQNQTEMNFNDAIQNAVINNTNWEEDEYEYEDEEDEDEYEDEEDDGVGVYE